MIEPITRSRRTRLTRLQRRVTALARRTSAAIASGVLIASLSPARANADGDDWAWYGGDPGGQQYSPLAQIDRGNVTGLELAWTYRTGELGEGLRRSGKMTFEATPILVAGRLYLSTPTDIVIALDPATGTELWRYDPRVPRDVGYAEVTSRGVSSWIDAEAPAQQTCRHRIFVGTLDARLLALDGASGRPCAGFGADGSVDLAVGVRMAERGDYLLTSPPAVYRDLVIVGSAIGDNRAVEVERGTVRAFDARTGALVWSWDPIPDAPDTAATQGWSPDAARRTGAANAWAVLSVDPGRDLVFVPTGSASPDFFGGERPGDNRHANSLVALRADTGEIVWSQQLVRHDLWDYDLPAQPTLVDLDHDGRSIPAIVQATKMGMLFVFDRESGEPVFDVVDRPVPPSDIPGEHVAETQRFATTPALASHAAISPEDAWGLTFYDRGKCRDLIQSLHSRGIYTPPSRAGTIESPGYAGGVNWGGVAYDAERQYVVAAVNHLPMVVQLLAADSVDALRDSAAYAHSEFALQSGTAWAMRRKALLSPWRLPCTAPPWGTLAAVDLKRNAIVWQVALGSTQDLTPWFVPSRTLGTPNMGGPIATAGGLVFIGAAMDDYLRAFDIETGRELWKGRLPAGGQATPMTYQAGQRQFVVIAAGGHGGLGTRRGDYVVAFALPREH
jgi:quinoprotein glucose dehydrogenase